MLEVQADSELKLLIILSENESNVASQIIHPPNWRQIHYRIRFNGIQFGD